MKKNIKDNIMYFTFENFDKTGVVKHCFSTKIGGVSENEYKSMNLSFRDDKKENVIENYKKICSVIGCDYRNVVFSNQIHEDNIYSVDEKDRGKGLLRESDIKNTDGLITDKKNICLVTFYADCVPLYFLDPIKKVIALSHSGWRGTAKQIGRKTVYIMSEKYGCKKENILCGIGPSIGACCYEVDTPVFEEFKNKIPFSEKYILKDKEKNDKYKINLQKINEQILLNSGIQKENIEIADICTKCNKDIFYSHRVMGDKRGSMAGLMELYL